MKKEILFVITALMITMTSGTSPLPDADEIPTEAA